jgi:hypothetical protein
MRARLAVVAVFVGVVAAGCAGSELKARKDNAWSHLPQALPDGYSWDNPYTRTMSRLPDPTLAGSDTLPGGYSHPFRAAGFVLHPVGVALDWVLVKPVYWLAGLAPEWFGLTVEDAQDYQRHYPELVVPRELPRRYE